MYYNRGGLKKRWWSKSKGGPKRNGEELEKKEGVKKKWMGV